MMVIVIISLLVTSYTFYSYTKERRVIQKRVESMNNFITSLEKDIPRKMFISGFRAVFIFNGKIVEQDRYINNVTESVQELFFNGTYQGQAQPIMNGATLADLKNDLKTQGAKININITLSNETISVSQTDPWNIQVTLIANISITDINKLAYWNKTLTATGIIPIFYFEDPVYLLNTGGLIATKINQTKYNSFDAASLLNHTQSQYYINSTEAPSFIDRLEGNITKNSQYGIESLVNIPRLQSQGIITQQKSIVDHIYFSSSNPPNCHISGQPSWFYIDNNHLPTYQASCG